MIRNQWYVVLESKEIKKRPVGVTRMGERLLFYRTNEKKLVCLVDTCAHRGAALSKGEIVHGDRILCPFHGLEYDPSGKCVLIPANGSRAPVPPNFRVTSYPTHEERGFVWIWWGLSPPDKLEPPKFFDDVPLSMRSTTVIDPWETHYSRVIENQLDCVHVPFVHRTTIGRNMGKLVSGPGIEWTSPTSFNMYVYNEHDNGQKPKKPDEVPIPNPSGFKLEFMFPNLWENRIADKVRVVAAFVPVDNDKTLLYLRFYQGFMKVPGLGWLIGKIASFFNTVVAHQDRRIVETQVPKISRLKMGENLIQGDYPIVEYRKKREELMKKGE